MANGELIATSRDLRGIALNKTFKLLDTQAGAADGVWIDLRDVLADVARHPKSVTLNVSGLGTGGVTFYGHTPPDGTTVPTNSDPHEAIGSEIASNGVWGIPRADLPWYVKMGKTTAGDSTATTVMASVDY